MNDFNPQRSGDTEASREVSIMAENTYKELIQIGRDVRSLLDNNESFSEYRTELTQLMRSLFVKCEAVIPLRKTKDSERVDNDDVSGDGQQEVRSILDIQKALTRVKVNMRSVVGGSLSEEYTILSQSVDRLIQILQPFKNS